MNHLTNFFASVSIVALGAAHASADTINFQEGVSPTGAYTHAAATIREDQPVANAGTGVSLVPGQIAGGNNLRAVFSFSLSAIPTGSTIDSVTLTLSRGGDGGSENANFTLELRPLTASFIENEVTWQNRSTGNNWATQGGDFGATVLSSTTANPTAATTLTFTSSSAFVLEAQNAFNSAAPLQFILKLDATGESGTNRRIFQIASDDNGTPGSRPLLTINYVPEPGSALLALGGGVALLLRRRRR